MPFQTNPFEKRLSDLIVMESVSPVTGFHRKNINVTPPAGSAPVLLGTVVFRAKSSDKAAPYAVVSAAGDLALTNEYAIVFGDEFDFNPSFVPRAIVANKFNAVAIALGPVQVKEYFLKQVHSSLNAAQFSSLKELLEKQGVEVLETA